MSAPACTEVAAFLDRLLGTPVHADYAHALNGLQLENSKGVRVIGAAVDVSNATIRGARKAAVDFLIVHHGLFWGGLQRLVGMRYERVRAMIEADMALYSVHLPLDSNPRFGNSTLLAEQLGLSPDAPFARYADTFVGVAGTCDMETAELVDRVRAFARTHATELRSTPVAADQRTRRWAICSGAGASSDTLREAAEAGVDTLIVGEGPHHTAVEAAELGITVIYAGHYATETLGVQAVARAAAAEFGLAWHFVEAPTGL